MDAAVMIKKDRLGVLVRLENVVSQSSSARKPAAKRERETVFTRLVHVVFVAWRQITAI